MSDAPCEFRPVVTVVDVLETGACFSGVCQWVVAHRGLIAAPFDEYQNEYIAKAANADGDGYGYGYGYGDGYGYGYGYGHGYGYGL